MIWRKSSFSGDTGGCVEVAWPMAGVAVRDSKHTGPAIEFPLREWREFLVNLQR